MELPKNISMDQLTNLVQILSTKLIGATFAEIKAINNNLTNKVTEAALYIGLILEQGGRYILTELGKKYFQAPETRGKNEALRELLKRNEMFNLTTEYFHHNKIEKPTKLDVGSYWNQNFPIKIKGMDEEELTSSIIFFFKFMELASLGKYINAGNGRETRIDLDMVELAKYITSNNTLTETKPLNKPEKKGQSPELTKNTPEEENFSGSLSILKKLNPELIWSDLDSDGAKKLIIDKINVLSNDNIVLNARVEEYQKIESINAVLKEKVHNLKADNLFRSSVNSIGGVIFGLAIALDNTLYQIIGGILGAILIGLSVFLKQQEPKKDLDHE